MTSEVAPNITEVRLVKENITFYEDTKRSDRGTLFITESCVTWRGENREFSIDYLNICLHAVSRDPYGGDENAKFPHPHLFLMVEGDHVWSNSHAVVDGHGDAAMEIDAHTGESEEDDDDDEGTCLDGDDEKTTSVLRFVPDDQRALEELYTALADCQALNPDPEDFSEGELEAVDEALDGNSETEENGDLENGTNGIDPTNFADA